MFFSKLCGYRNSVKFVLQYKDSFAAKRLRPVGPWSLSLFFPVVPPSVHRLSVQLQ